MYRKTRLVCVSDTHAYTPSEAGFRLPAGDVLIHAGDLTNQGSLAELRKTMAWIATAPYEVKIVIAGNHDLGLDPTRTEETTQHEQCMEAVRKCNDPSIVYLCHESARIRLTRADGPRTEFTVFGSPYTPVTSPDSKWKAFGYSSWDSFSDNNHQNSSKSTDGPRPRPGPVGGGHWNQIPLDTDLVVTHTPPYAHRDRHDGHSGHSQVPAATSSSSGDPRARPVGCPALRQALQRVRPRIAVCGHVHESRGCERLLWPSPPSPPPPPPPSSSLVPLVSWQMTRDGTEEQDPTYAQAQCCGCQVVTVDLPPIGSKKQSLVNLTGSHASHHHHHHHHHHHYYHATTFTSTDGSKKSSSSNRPHARRPSPPRMATTQQPPHQETCLVNAAILATSWPHPGGKRFHTPVVVDVDFRTTSPTPMN